MSQFTEEQLIELELVFGLFRKETLHVRDGLHIFGIPAGDLMAMQYRKKRA
jgi:hypothetical protein